MLSVIILSALAAGGLAFPAITKRDEYIDTVLYHHNIHRENHTATDLTWSTDLTNSAQILASRCNFAHDTTINGGNYGQNLAAGFAAADIHLISDVWYNGEINAYGDQYGSEPDMSNFENWGHFTQVVWVGTSQVGCATQDCTSSGLQGVSGNVPPYLTVCNYGAPGNYEGEFAANVLAPHRNPTVT